MTSACPHCGGEVKYSEAEARLLTATCAACGKAVTVVSGVGLSPGDQEGLPAPEATEAATSGQAPRCEECGTALVVRSAARGSLEAECPECETTLTFVREGAGSAGPPESERGDARRGPSRARFRDDSGRRPRGFASPNARPCRQCGAPLRFSTGEDGNLVGECTSCGNRFTLPVRQDFGGKGGYRGRPAFRRPDRGGYRGGGRPPRSGRPYGRSQGGYRDRYRNDDENDDDTRRRRRPRRE